MKLPLLTVRLGARVIVPIFATINIMGVAHAVVVRGTVRDPLGRAVAARVQLVQGTQAVANTISQVDGSYEIRSTAAGRFLLLVSSPGFAERVSPIFYGRALDVTEQNLTLTLAPVRDEITVTATGLPTPLEQTSAAVTLIPDDELSTRYGVADELRLQPGVSVVQSGGFGGVTSVFVRGGNSDANEILIDGIPADDIGGRFDFSTVTSTAVSGLESHRGPNSVLYGTDALASTIRFDTPHGTSLYPVLNYSGDAGNFHTWRNEAEISGTLRRLDYYGAFSRFDSSNARPENRFHVSTGAGNLGYQFNSNLSVRGTLRSSISASGSPGPFDFYGLSSRGKQADQDLYFSGALDGVYHNNLHTVLRYLGARKREQFDDYDAVGEPVVFTFPDFSFTGYFGRQVTIKGANGTSGTGQAEFATGINDRSDYVSDRDGMSLQSDYSFSQHFSALAGFRFLDEHGSYRNASYGLDQAAERRDYQYTLQFQGDVRNRIFLSLGGAVQHNTLYGTEGTPRLGIVGYPVRPGGGWLRGTKLHFNFSKGVQEPNLTAQTSSLYTTLTNAGQASALNPYGIAPINAQRVRTYEGGVDQNVYGDRLKFKLNYFHNQFGRQIEYVGSSDLSRYFDIPLPIIAPSAFGAYLNSLDFRAMGAETQLEFAATHRLFIRGGYTFLDARVEKSFSGDVTAVLDGFANSNPNYPGVPIGNSSPLLGARPFRRAPHTGFAVVEYGGSKIDAAVKTAFSSRSDDSTFLAGLSLAQDNSLLLPNRNLAYGFARMDANLTYKINPVFSVFSQMDNLLGQQHIGPIGYPALPFQFRAGVKFRLARE